MVNIFEEIYKDKLPSQIPWNRKLPHFRLIDFLNFYNLKPCRVLELGCGLGTDAIFLAKEKFLVSAIDISQTAVYQARNRSQEAGVKIDFWVSSALKLPFKDNTFDLVFDWRTFHCLNPKDWKKYASEASRVLKKGGGFLLVAFYLSGVEGEDTKVLSDPIENHPINEDKLKEIFGKDFQIRFSKIFVMDEKSKKLAGMYYLEKGLVKRKK